MNKSTTTFKYAVEWKARGKWTRSARLDDSPAQAKMHASSLPALQHRIIEIIHTELVWDREITHE